MQTYAIRRPTPRGSPSGSTRRLAQRFLGAVLLASASGCALTLPPGYAGLGDPSNPPYVAVIYGLSDGTSGGVNNGGSSTATKQIAVNPMAGKVITVTVGETAQDTKLGIKSFQLKASKTGSANTPTVVLIAQTPNASQQVSDFLAISGKGPTPPAPGDTPITFDIAAGDSVSVTGVAMNFGGIATTLTANFVSPSPASTSSVTDMLVEIVPSMSPLSAPLPIPKGTAKIVAVPTPANTFDAVFTQTPGGFASFEFHQGTFSPFPTIGGLALTTNAQQRVVIASFNDPTVNPQQVSYMIMPLATILSFSGTVPPTVSVYEKDPGSSTKSEAQLFIDSGDGNYAVSVGAPASAGPTVVQAINVFKLGSAGGPPTQIGGVNNVASKLKSATLETATTTGGSMPTAVKRTVHLTLQNNTVTDVVVP